MRNVNNDPFNLNPIPERTKYRLAVLLPNFVDDYPEVEMIRHLAEKDRKFMMRLDNDKAFHDMFWFYKMIKWERKTSEEETAFEEFNTAMKDRITLVMAQKVLLGRFFHLLGDEEKKRLYELAMDELTFVNTWVYNNNMPNHNEIIRKYQNVWGTDYFKKDISPDEPMGDYDWMP